METTETTTTQPTNPRRWPWIAAVFVALFVGVGIGAVAADAEPAAVETPEPETIVETVVETETVEVEVTPQACIDALDIAVETFNSAADMFDVTLAWYDELFNIIDADGYLITAEWNHLDAKYAPLMDAIQIPEVGDTAQECRDLG